MKSREQVVFDLSNEKFRYLQRDTNKRLNKVSLIEINKRLNQTKKINFYTNLKIFSSLIICFGIFAIISLKI